MTLRRPVAVLSALVAFAGIVRAASTTQPSAQSQHATLTLVSDASTIAPGKPFTVALKFDMDPEWHIYWKDAGDSGMPPSVKWSLPSGFVAGELMFPTPEVLKTEAGTNYVHDGEVALLVRITPPADLAVGSAVPIGADVKWLECDAERCLSAKASVAIGLSAAAAPVANEPERFAGWQKKVEAGKSFDPKAGAGASAGN